MRGSSVPQAAAGGAVPCCPTRRDRLKTAPAEGDAAGQGPQCPAAVRGHPTGLSSCTEISGNEYDFVFFNPVYDPMLVVYPS
jgi:hypothetical protein